MFFVAKLAKVNNNVHVHFVLGAVTCQAARLATFQILAVLGWHLCKCAILPLVTCIHESKASSFFNIKKVNLEIQCHLKEAETKDITHVDILGRFFSCLTIMFPLFVMYFWSASRLVMVINYGSVVLILKTG